MPELIRLTIDGRSVEVEPGTLVIEAARRVGVKIPSFCYYEGLSLAGACRMCLVEVEKMPKLQTACTLVATPGMVVRTDTPQVAEARRAMVEFLLTNHPLDCPVCDKGGECELQDMAFRYGAAESRYLEAKHHVPEQQWSPVVFYDRPRCILCYRCVRVCDEGMGVGALGVVNRGGRSEIAPNRGDHLECDECGACIDICPVGALTSGMYRYQTRPWEMNHVGTICAFCADGCKTTLGVYHDRIMRGNNRDRSGLNGEFLCIKGRYAADFPHHPARLSRPLVRQDGELRPASWLEALSLVEARLREALAAGSPIGVIGSNHTTNEENYFLQKFARQWLKTNHLDHQRTGDVPALASALAGREGTLASTEDLYTARAVLVVGADLAQQHPLLSWQIRANWRHHRARIYVVTTGPVREDRYAARSVRVEPGGELEGLLALAEALRAEPDLVILFGDAIQGEDVARLVAFGDSLGIPVKYVCLVDYANSRGAADMGLLPDLGPGYQPLERPGMTLEEMLECPDLAVLWVVGANPLIGRQRPPSRFLLVQDLFLTETARLADVVLPAASAYEKDGTVTNVCGEVQRLRKVVAVAGVKTDLEIFSLLACRMGFQKDPVGWETVLREIADAVPGYRLSVPALLAGAPQRTHFASQASSSRRGKVRSARDTLFTSGTLGRFATILSQVREAPGALYRG
ncbi:MAG: NADH-quinone oxidoreductase subunit NuoG [Bryobacterales bacterium]|nr:NADH-quinone oxidoreductase subunit NuoG [Bryobacteraceae bacterium]MDW8131096.1 NADH-quinone oxidoreductase subunit NuoG [Bryobacterales bacterium]